MALRVVTPPEGLLLSLEDAKAHLDLVRTDQDALVTGLIAAAQRHAERVTQRRYLPQVIEWVRDSWCDRMVLPIASGGDSDKIAIASVKYADQLGAMQTLDAATMYWDRPAGPTRAVVRQWFAVWPWVGDAAERVVIRIAINSTAADAPPEVLTAMKLLVGHFYEHREAVVGVENRDSSAPLPIGIDELLGPPWEAA
jgi:uncharacterized phiE125 gp8 family phage protein